MSLTAATGLDDGVIVTCCVGEGIDVGVVTSSSTTGSTNTAAVGFEIEVGTNDLTSGVGDGVGAVVGAILEPFFVLGV